MLVCAGTLKLESLDTIWPVRFISADSISFGAVSIAEVAPLLPGGTRAGAMSRRLREVSAAVQLLSESDVCEIKLSTGRLREVS